MILLHGEADRKVGPLVGILETTVNIIIIDGENKASWEGSRPPPSTKYRLSLTLNMWFLGAFTYRVVGTYYLQMCEVSPHATGGLLMTGWGLLFTCIKVG